MGIPSMKAEIRKETGKNKVNQMRKMNYLPGVIYGRGESTEHIKINKLEFQKLLNNYGSSAMVDLKLNEKTIPTIIKEVQRHITKDEILHVDFQKLRADEKVKMTIPITLIGKEKIQIHPSIVIQQLDDLEIECLPKYIPQSIEADISNINFKIPFMVKDLDICKNENVTIINEPEDTVAILTTPTRHDEEETEEEEIVEPEVIGKSDIEE